ncbi:hypothetical protein, partial [Bacillus sp. J33]|uniref:hypothetical protein n=1 Tax=Bacillus sp. J33 TaxID=935836 RepID=UPI000478A4A0
SRFIEMTSLSDKEKKSVSSANTLCDCPSHKKPPGSAAKLEHKQPVNLISNTVIVMDFSFRLDNQLN